MIKKVAAGEEEEEMPKSLVSDVVSSNPVLGISFFCMNLSTNLDLIL